MKLRQFLTVLILTGLANTALAQDIYGNSTAGDIYASPANIDHTSAKVEEEAADNQQLQQKKEENLSRRIQKYQKQKRAFLISSLAVGIGGGGAGLGAGVELLSLSKKMDNRIAHPQMTDSQIYIHDLQEASAKNRKAAYVSFGIGGAAVAAAVVLGIFEVRAKHKLDKLQVAIIPSFSQEQSSLAMVLAF